MANYKIPNNRIKIIDPDKTEHHMNLQRIISDDNYKTDKIKRILKRAAVATAIGISIFLVSKSLKAEEVSTDLVSVNQVSVSSEQSQHVINYSTSNFDRNSSNPLNSTVNKIVNESKEIMNNALNIQSKKETNTKIQNELNELDCKLGNNSKKYYMNEISKCLSSNNKDYVTNAITELLNEDIILSKEVRNKIANLVLYADEFDYNNIMEVIKMHKIGEAVPSIIKRLESDSNGLDPMFNYSIPALGVFAVKGDWNAINTLLSILKNNPDEDIKSLAAACLIHVDKNVMPEIIQFYKSISEEKRVDFIGEMQRFRAFDIDMNNMTYNEKAVFSRIIQLLNIEKSKEVRKELEISKPSIFEDL
ncbi:MAG: hypothetical protein QXF07_02640 [Candidatus Micrarchaeia archaeon]